MPQVLELAHLVQQHRVAQVQVGRGRVEAGLDPQRPALGQARGQFVDLEDFVGAAGDQFKGLAGGVGLGHGGAFQELGGNEGNVTAVEWINVILTFTAK